MSVSLSFVVVNLSDVAAVVGQRAGSQWSSGRSSVLESRNLSWWVRNQTDRVPSEHLLPLDRSLHSTTSIMRRCNAISRIQRSAWIGRALCAREGAHAVQGVRYSG